MKTYELLLVLDNAIADDAKETALKKFEDVIVNAGGSVANVEKWGAKKLAYPINYKTDGYYVLVTFDADGSVVKELDRVAGLSSEVLRRLVTVKTYVAPAVNEKSAKEEKVAEPASHAEKVEAEAAEQPAVENTAE